MRLLFSGDSQTPTLLPNPRAGRGSRQGRRGHGTNHTKHQHHSSHDSRHGDRHGDRSAGHRSRCRGDASGPDQSAALLRALAKLGQQPAHAEQGLGEVRRSGRGSLCRRAGRPGDRRHQERRHHRSGPGLRRRHHRDYFRGYHSGCRHRSGEHVRRGHRVHGRRARIRLHGVQGRPHRRCGPDRHRQRGSDRDRLGRCGCRDGHRRGLGLLDAYGQLRLPRRPQRHPGHRARRVRGDPPTARTPPTPPSRSRGSSWTSPAPATRPLPP